ncbi:hypothetical protein IR213_10015 [Flavobacterium soyangense]|uniref:DUF4168 domain-containing protein n=2 Tax=Flavobacterium soyangense TaxID=2023265 RepID=A0A930UCL2_9FLAO|nr:hypothetical protein [Flavobacterium soyangense]
MKTTKTFLASIFMLLSITTISAQYGNSGYGGNRYGGNGYGNGYGGNGYGSGGGINQRSEPEKPKEIPAEVTVAKVLEDMKPAVELDELQVIAISNVLIESLNTQGRILKQDTTQEEQLKDFQALSENTDRQIMNFLNTVQKEKYLAFKEDRKNPKKSKSKEKKK